MNRSSNGEFFLAGALLVHELVAFRDFDIHGLVLCCRGKGDIVIQELPPEIEQHVESQAALLDWTLNLTNQVADVSWLRKVFPHDRLTVLIVWSAKSQ